MPFIDDENTVDLTKPADFPKGFAVTPGEEDLSGNPPDRPSWNWGAAFRTNNEVGALISSESKWEQNQPEDGFNPWDKIKGTPDEAHWDKYATVRNSRMFDATKRDIERGTEDRKLLASQPWWMGLITEGGASIASPTTLLPGGQFVRGAKGGFSLVKSAASVGLAGGAGTAVQEGMLQNIEQTRTAAESATAIGASVFLSAMLGAGGSALLSRGEWQKGVAALEAELARPAPAMVASGSPASVGAAANTATGLADNSIAGRMASGVASASQNFNPLLRAHHSPSAVYRDVMLNTVESPLYLKKNFDGVASAPAVETLMKEWNGGLAKAIQTQRPAWLAYRKAGGDLDYSEFLEAAGKAARRNDSVGNEHIDAVARAHRSNLIDPLKEAAISAKLLPEGVSVDNAPSYFSRMWNAKKISADETGFKGMVEDYVNRQMPRLIEAFDRETAERATKLKDNALVEYNVERRIERADRFETPDGARAVANDVFDTLTGRGVDTGVRPDILVVKARGPLKERTFDINDLFVGSNGRAVENYLEHNIEVVNRRYARIMGADVELAGKFGSVDMADQIRAVREDYAKLRAGVTDEKKLTSLKDRERDDIADLEAVRDMLRGTNPGAPADGNYARTVRMVNMVNYLRSMGEVAIASLAETVRPAMVHGLGQYMSTLGQTLGNMKGFKLAVGEAQLAGNVTERILGTRLATLSEIIDPYASRGPVESFLENMTNVASKWNGIRLLTDMQKSIASVMTQNRILQNVAMFHEIKPNERAYLTFLGIDESMAGRIAQQFADHGEVVEKVRVANTEKWTDPVAVRAYRAAMNKDVDSIITTKGVADTPLFANTPTGRAMLQFKSFALASHQRVLLRGLQEDQARFVGGMIAMTTIGIMATYLKAVSGNRTEKLQDIGKDPGWWIAEGLDKSGIFAIPMELANTFEKASGFNPIKTPIKSFDEGAAISQKNQNKNLTGALLGPSVGLAEDIGTVAGVPQKMLKGDEVTQGQKNSAERLLPFNSYAGIRQMLRYVANPPQ